jgi:arylformamidase
MIKQQDIVVLSQRIEKEREFFKIETRVEDISKTLTDTHHRKDIWYVLGEVTFCTHVGTHIEAPYHHVKDGMDVADLPTHKLIGNCVVLDFRNKKDKEKITLEEIKKYDAFIHEGDLVFIMTGMDKYYGTSRWMEMPYLAAEANLWLINKKIGCLGMDSAGLEIPGTDNQPNHTELFKAQIPQIESLTNLDKIENGKYIVIVLPLPIRGLDASPLRVVAIRKEALKNALQ